MESVIKRGPLLGAILQGHPYRVRTVEVVHRIFWIRVLRPRDQWLSRRLVTGGHAHYAVRVAIGVAAVNLVCRDIAVPEQISGTAASTAAILNRILVAVLLYGHSRGIDAGRQCEVGTVQRTQPGHLPTADQLLHDPSRITGESLAAADGQVDDPVPAHFVLGEARIAADVSLVV